MARRSVPKDTIEAELSDIQNRLVMIAPLVKLAFDLALSEASETEESGQMIALLSVLSDAIEPVPDELDRAILRMARTRRTRSLRTDGRALPGASSAPVSDYDLSPDDLRFAQEVQSLPPGPRAHVRRLMIRMLNRPSTKGVRSDVPD